MPGAQLHGRFNGGCFVRSYDHLSRLGKIPAPPRAIEHEGGATAELLALMRQRGVALAHTRRLRSYLALRRLETLRARAAADARSARDVPPRFEIRRHHCQRKQCG